MKILKWGKRVFYSAYFFFLKEKDPILNNLSWLSESFVTWETSAIDHIPPGFYYLEELCLERMYLILIFVKVLLSLVEKVLLGVFL